MRMENGPLKLEENALSVSTSPVGKDESPIELKSGQHVRVVSGHEAERLADLTGVQRDLRLVADACRVIRSRRESPSADVIRRACFDSAVMRYRRCLNNSVRDLLPKAILDQLTVDELTLHERILELADKSVAHCVDGSEENITYVLIGPKLNLTIPLDLRVLTTTVSHHNVIDVEAMENLAGRLEALTRAECDGLAATIMVALEAMGIPQIRALPKLDSTIKGGQPQLKKYRKAPKVRK